MQNSMNFQITGFSNTLMSTVVPQNPKIPKRTSRTFFRRHAERFGLQCNNRGRIAPCLEVPLRNNGIANESRISLRFQNGKTDAGAQERGERPVL